MNSRKQLVVWDSLVLYGIYLSIYVRIIVKFIPEKDMDAGGAVFVIRVYADEDEVCCVCV